MEKIKWYEPYKPRLATIIKRIRRRYWYAFAPTLILLVITYYPFNWSFYKHLHENFGTTSLRIGIIYSAFALQRIAVVLGLSEVFAYLLLRYELRKDMRKFWIGLSSVLLAIAGLPFIFLYAPIGYAMKKIREQRLTRRLIKRKEKKAPRVQEIIVNDPKLAHEHFVNAHLYLRGEKNHHSDINAAIYEFMRAVSYGHYLASYHLAKIYAGFEETHVFKPNYALAEKYALNCLLAYTVSDDDLGRLYYLYGEISEKVAHERSLNEHDVYLLLQDFYAKALKYGVTSAEEKLKKLAKDYRYFNKEDVSTALQREPFTFLLNEYEDDLQIIKYELVKTPLERLS